MKMLKKMENEAVEVECVPSPFPQNILGFAPPHFHLPYCSLPPRLLPCVASFLRRRAGSRASFTPLSHESPYPTPPTLPYPPTLYPPSYDDPYLRLEFPSASYLPPPCISVIDAAFGYEGCPLLYGEAGGG